MSVFVKSRQRRLIVAAVIALLLGFAATMVFSNRTGSTSATASGAGTLTVDGVVYSFTPTTCFISESDFVAAGKGHDGTDQFWVSASSVSLDIAVGTKNELDQPSADKLWLVSDEITDWRADGEVVTAVAPMIDRRASAASPVEASLLLQCDNAGV